MRNPTAAAGSADPRGRSRIPAANVLLMDLLIDSHSG
jgi:hypothetical protein